MQMPDVLCRQICTTSLALHYHMTSHKCEPEGTCKMLKHMLMLIYVLVASNQNMVKPWPEP